jgi:hypothetical protein
MTDMYRYRDYKSATTLNTLKFTFANFSVLYKLYWPILGKNLCRKKLVQNFI